MARHKLRPILFTRQKAPTRSWWLSTDRDDFMAKRDAEHARIHQQSRASVGDRIVGTRYGKV